MKDTRINALSFTNPEMRKEYLSRNGITECFIVHEGRGDWRIYEGGGNWCGFEAATFSTRRGAIAFARDWERVTGLDCVGTM